MAAGPFLRVGRATVVVSPGPDTNSASCRFRGGSAAIARSLARSAPRYDSTTPPRIRLAPLTAILGLWVPELNRVDLKANAADRVVSDGIGDSPSIAYLAACRSRKLIRVKIRAFAAERVAGKDTADARATPV